MIKRLHWLVFKMFLGPTLASLAITVFILMLQFLLKNAERLIGKGLDYSIIFEFLGYGIFGVLPMALPLAILMASLMTFGNLGENNELTAVKAAGISMYRLMLPLAVWVGFLALATLYFSTNILPVTNGKMAELTHKISKLKPEMNLEPGVYNSDISGYTIKVDAKNVNSGMLYGFVIYDHSEAKGNLSMSYADSATLKITTNEENMMLTMYSGYSFVEGITRNDEKNTTYPLRRNNFEKQIAIMDLEANKEEKYIQNIENQFIWRQDDLLKNVETLRHFKDTARVYYAKEIFVKRLFNAENHNRKNYSKEIPQSFPLNTDSIYAEANAAKANLIIDKTNENISSFKYMVDIHLDLQNWKDTIISRIMIAWHKKYSLSLMVFVFFFIGAPLGTIIRKGSMGLPAVVSVAFFVAFYIITLMGEKLIQKGGVSPALGIWIPITIMIALAAFINYKAATDSAIMSMETYTKLVKRVTGIFDKNK